MISKEEKLLNKHSDYTSTVPENGCLRRLDRIRRILEKHGDNDMIFATLCVSSNKL